MFLPAFNQIKWKLTLVILSTSLVVLVLGTVAVLVYDMINSRQNLVSQVGTIAEITAANSSAALAFQNRRDAEETLNSLRVRSEIDFACLYLGDGRPFVYFDLMGQPPESPSAWSDLVDQRFEKGRLVLKRKVRFGDDAVGSIVIIANLKQQVARSNTFLGIALVSLIGLTGVASLLATRLQRLVSDPIAKLAEAANHITAHKDYSVRFPPDSSYEIGALVAAFNQMLAEIDRQNRTLIESERQLKLALSASNMGVWEWNVQTNALSWSVESIGFFGAPETTTFPGALAQLVHPEDVDQVISVMKSSVEKLTPFMVEYRIVRPGKNPLWVAHHGQVRRDADGKPVVLAGIVQNISNRKQADADRQKLVAQLLHAEEEERRRIARELHDTTAQHLAALKINLTRLPGDQATHPHDKLQAESRQLLDQAIQEIRTLTYVLHPPVLEEFGLVDALLDFAFGVTRRSPIKVVVNHEGYEGRLPRTIELTLFRVIQESISNAVRHSGTEEVHIRLVREPNEVRVEIQDFGHGFPEPLTKTDTKLLRNSGVGMAAMKERMILVGGTLNVEWDSEGVTVLASVPLAAEAPASAQPSPANHAA